MKEIEGGICEEISTGWGEDNEKEIRKTGKDTQKEFTGEKDT